MMNFAFKTRDFVLKTRNCAFKTRDFVFKMTIGAASLTDVEVEVLLAQNARLQPDVKYGLEYMGEELRRDSSPLVSPRYVAPEPVAIPFKSMNCLIRNDGFCIQNDDIFKADAKGVKEVAGTAVGKMTRVKLTRPAVDGKKKV